MAATWTTCCQAQAFAAGYLRLQADEVLKLASRSKPAYSPFPRALRWSAG